MEYLVNITVHGVGGLKFADTAQDGTAPNPYVEVVCFGRQSVTPTAKEAHFAELESLFSLTSTMKRQDFMETDLTVTVFHSYMGGMRSQKMGSITFGLGKVYNCVGHSASRAWYPISLVESPADVMGFVQLTLGAYGPGDAMPRQVHWHDTPDESGSRPLKSRVVTLPGGDAKNLYQLAVRIYRAEGLASSTRLFASVDPFVRVKFNGSEECSKVVPRSASPKWNEEVRLPFNYPSWDDNISVSLLCKGGLGFAVREVGSISIALEDILLDPMDPTWFNFYKSPDGSIEGEQESEFAGRMLIAANCTRNERPVVGVFPTAVKMEPPLRNCWLHVDLYSLLFNCPEDISSCWVVVAMAPGVFEVQSQRPTLRTKCTFEWADEGRLPPIDIMVPDPEQCADVIVSVYTEMPGWMGSTTKRHMFNRTPASKVLRDEASASWVDMTLVESGVHATSGGFLLCSVNVTRSRGPPAPRMQMSMSKYIFRALIYQCVNLPAADDIGTSDVFVVVFFGSALLSTPIYAKSLHPTFNSVLEAEVEMPDVDTMRPDILIYVMDQDTDSFSPIAKCRYSTADGALPLCWSAPPEWLDLEEAPGGPLTHGKLLAGFEMFPAGQARRYKRTGIAPDTVKCRVEIFIIGIRLDDAVELFDPVVEVAWGRKNTDEAAWVTPGHLRHTIPGRHVGENGRYNFLDKLVLSPCSLARDPYYQEYLEIKVVAAVAQDSDELVILCCAAVHLTPHLPWVDEKRQEKARLVHSVRTRGTQQQADSYVAEGHLSELSDDENVVSASTCRDVRRFGASIIREREQELTRSLGWQFKSVSDSNSIPVEQVQEHSCNTRTARRIFSENLATAREVGEEDVGAKSNNSVSAFQKDFAWPLLLDDAVSLGDHRDLGEEDVEDSRLPVASMPYLTTPLFRGSSEGEQRKIGTLKYIVRVVERARYKAGGPQMERENEAFREKIDGIRGAFGESVDLWVRAYVLGADVTPPSGNADCRTYVWTTVSTQSDSRYSIRDEATLREATLHPEYNTVHKYSACAFPEHSQLKVMVYEKVRGLVPGDRETLIGSTSIDLEDRWFHPGFRDMVMMRRTPVETRALSRDGSMYAQGHVRVWIEVLSNQDCSDLPYIELPASEPEEYQLRVVVWQVTDIRTIDDTVPSVQVVGRVTLDNGEHVEQSTDIHNRASDGIGTFNWRFLFKVFVPCRSMKLQLMLWDVGVFASDTIAQVTLDLGADCTAAHKFQEAVELPRGKLRMYHLSEPSEVRALIDLEGVLLGGREALRCPAGCGREEPNAEPFLDPEDAHLLRGRQGLASAIVAEAGGLVSGAVWAGKWMFAMYLAGGIVSAIVSLTLSLMIYNGLSS